MPLYEYECKACGNRFEKIQKFSDPLVTLCPKCGKESVEQMLSAPAFTFKGSGFYKNDYAPKQPAGGNSGNDSSSSSSGSDGSSGDAKAGNPKPENKPESKSESTAAASTNTENK